MNQRDRVATFTDAGGELTFVRVAADRVHVVRPDLPGEELVGVPISPEGEPASASFAAAMADWVIRGGPRQVTLCGHTIRLNYTGAPDSTVNGNGHLVDAFPDDGICWACVKALGDLSRLAFAHPQTEEQDDGS
jgi:hypothetical protein